MERLKVLSAALALGEFSVDEVAALSGVKPKTVRSVLSRSRDVVRRLESTSQGLGGRPSRRWAVIDIDSDAARDLMVELRGLSGDIEPQTRTSFSQTEHRRDLPVRGETMPGSSPAGPVESADRDPLSHTFAGPTDGGRAKLGAELLARAAQVQANGWEPYRGLWSVGEVSGVAVLLGEQSELTALGETVESAWQRWAFDLCGLDRGQADVDNECEATREWFLNTANQLASGYAQLALEFNCDEFNAERKAARARYLALPPDDRARIEEFLDDTSTAVKRSYGRRPRVADPDGGAE